MFSEICLQIGLYGFFFTLFLFQFHFKPIHMEEKTLPIRFFDCPGTSETIGSEELEMLIKGYMKNGSEVFVKIT